MKDLTIREVALTILEKIEKDQAYSNLLLNQMIKKYDVTGKDTALLTEIVYGTIQRKLTIDYFLSHFLQKRKKMDLWVQLILRMSVYQMVYLDRVPDHAIIHEAVAISKKRGHKGISGLINGVLRNIQRNGVPSLESIKDKAERLAIETSHPVWLVKRWVNQYGQEQTRRLCESNLVAPSITARVNCSITNVDDVIEQLKEEGVSAKRGRLSIDSVEVERGNLVHTNLYKKGLITIQDESSMLVARALSVSANQTVLDSCAAPGGKTTHIAELLQNTGKVISVDLHAHKVKLIDDQVRRLHLSNVETVVSDSRLLHTKYHEQNFDRILVDAPCTGFGVIRRKPDIKYAKNEEDIYKLAKIQMEILESVAPLLKNGGYLVYSTCTIDRDENESVIKKFIELHPDFKEEPLQNHLPDKVGSYIRGGKLQILPHYFDTDGFFIALLRKQV